MIRLHLLQNKEKEDASYPVLTTPSEDTKPSLSELLDKYRIEAINTRFYTLLKRKKEKKWDKMAITNEELARTSGNRHRIDHSWWTGIALHLENRPPNPDYAAVL